MYSTAQYDRVIIFLRQLDVHGLVLEYYLKKALGGDTYEKLLKLFVSFLPGKSKVQEGLKQQTIEWNFNFMKITSKSISFIFIV